MKTYHLLHYTVLILAASFDLSLFQLGLTFMYPLQEGKVGGRASVFSCLRRCNWFVTQLPYLPVAVTENSLRPGEFFILL